MDSLLRVDLEARYPSWMSDYIGLRGERIFETLMSELDTHAEALFTARFLGDKWSIVDFIVRLEGVSGAPFFFAQVKTTQRGYTASGRLRARVTADEMKALAACPAPTYIVGVDEPSASCFLVSAKGEKSATMSTIPTAFPLDRGTRELLWREVADYWSEHAPPGFVSRFADPGGSR